MPARKLSLILIYGMLVGAVIILSVVRFVAFRPVADDMAPSAQNTIHSDLPLRLKIPKISVDATIDYVGLSPEGDLGVPSGYDSVGWYKDGPQPGQPGSAVFDGHFGRADKGPAVFDNLHQLQKGDRISVIDIKGVTTVFVVTGSRSYNPTEDATAVFRSNDGKPRLNLITCQGSWDNGQGGYAARLVVFSEKENP